MISKLYVSLILMSHRLFQLQHLLRQIQRSLKKEREERISGISYINSEFLSDKSYVTERLDNLDILVTGGIRSP